MKMNLAIIITSTLLISTSALANGWNVDVFGGKQNSDNLDWAGSSYSTDSGDSYGIGVSKQVSPRLGLGFEVGYTKNEYSNFKPDSLSGRSIMLTTEYDFVQRGNFSAYGGLGVGAIKVKYKNNTFNHEHNDTVGGGRLSLGARYAISPRAKYDTPHISDHLLR